MPGAVASGRVLRAARTWDRRDLAFLTRAAVVAAVAPPLLRVLPLPTVLRGVSRRLTAAPLPEPARLVRLTDGLLRTDRGGLRPSCVPRTLVLLRYLPGAGAPVTARFGVRRAHPSPAGPAALFAGHAWVERDGAPWAEPRDPRPDYRVMYSWPPEAPARTPEATVARTPPPSPAARLFPASHRLTRAALGAVGRAVEVGKAAHAGIWLGVLSDDDLVAVDEATYRGKYAYHATDAHNLRGLFDWEATAIADHFPPTGHLLVTSAGGGREVVALRRRGFTVTAFECNEALRRGAGALLQREGLGGEVSAAPRDGFPPDERQYDGVVVGWGSLTYVRGRERRRRFLEQLRERLRPGAPALLSFYARARDGEGMRLVSRVGTAVGRWLGRPPVELGDVIDPVFQHYFSEEELRSEVTAAGLAVESWSTTGFAHAVVRRPG